MWSWKPLSTDHKPDLPAEMDRITNNNGRVAWYKDNRNKNVGPPRVWLKNSQVPGLAMSRSFGDEVATLAGVIHKPEIKHFSLNNSDKAIVLASDGVWEFVSNKLVLKLLLNWIKTRNPRKGWEKIMSESVKQWKMRDSIIDDITVIVVILATDKTNRMRSIASAMTLNPKSPHNDSLDDNK